MNLDFIKTILEFIGLIFIPVIAWLLNTVSQHGKKIIILEERVNDSINRRLTNLENKFDQFEKKLDDVKSSAITATSLIEKLDEKIDDFNRR